MIKKLCIIITLLVVPLQVNAGWNAWIDHSITKIKQNGYDSYNAEVKSGDQSHLMQMARKYSTLENTKEKLLKRYLQKIPRTTHG